MSDMAPSEPTAPDTSKGLGGFGYLLAGIMAMPLAILIAWWGLRPVAKSAGDGPSQASAAVSAAGGSTAAAMTDPAAPSGIVVAKVDQLGDPNPFAPFWNDAAACDVKLLPQSMTTPALLGIGIDAISIRAARDAQDIAFRLTWTDTTPDQHVDTGRFCDAVALQFPLTPGASPMMGFGGGKVHIFHWKGIWQSDVEHGYQDDTDLHPFTYQDFYWFAEGCSIRDSFKDPRSHAWLIAYSAGSPMAIFTRTQPVEECFAAGFGSLTTRPRRLVRGNGAWTRDTWTVVIQRALSTDDAEEHQFDPAKPTQVAFALWDGAKGQVGGRKMWSMWNEVTYAP